MRFVAWAAIVMVAVGAVMASQPAILTGLLVLVVLLNYDEIKTTWKEIRRDENAND